MHLDTPCDILHTILLGAVKYVWLEATKHIKKTDNQKDILKQRLVSVCTTGLGIDSINPVQLVNFSGSPVGKDFRTVAQIAPFVLKGMISISLYTCCIYLQQLCAIAYVQEIDDIEVYIVSFPIFSLLYYSTLY